MPRTISANDMIEIAKPYAAPKLLLDYLNQLVPEFVNVRATLRDHFEPLWDVLKQQMDALGDRLSPDKDAFRQMRLLETKLNADERLNLILNNYRQRLWLLAHSLGNPPLFEELMLSEDFVSVLKTTKFNKRFIELVRDDEIRHPGTWMATFYQMIEYGPNKALGISSSLQVLQRDDWKAVNERQQKLIKAVRRGLTQPDPRMKIVSWCLVKVQGFNAREIGRLRGVSEEQIRAEVQTANRLLRVTPRKGAPRKAMLPTRLWNMWANPENNG